MIAVDFNNTLAGNWDERMHLTGQSIPANSHIWGLNILDWDSSFTTRLKAISTADLSIPFQYLENMNILS